MSPTLMGLSAANLFASLVIGTIGMGFFLYGKKQQRMPQLIAGLGLMVYPYFVPNVGWMLAVGALWMIALFAVVRHGW